MRIHFYKSRMGRKTHFICNNSSTCVFKRANAFVCFYGNQFYVRIHRIKISSMKLCVILINIYWSWNKGFWCATFKQSAILWCISFWKNFPSNQNSKPIWNFCKKRKLMFYSQQFFMELKEYFESNTFAFPSFGPRWTQDIVVF